MGVNRLYHILRCVLIHEGHTRIIIGVAGVNECSKKALLNASRPNGSISFGITTCNLCIGEWIVRVSCVYPLLMILGRFVTIMIVG